MSSSITYLDEFAFRAFQQLLDGGIKPGVLTSRSQRDQVFLAVHKALL